MSLTSLESALAVIERAARKADSCQLTDGEATALWYRFNDLETAVEFWQRQAVELGWGPEAIVGSLQRKKGPSDE